MSNIDTIEYWQHRYETCQQALANTLKMARKNWELAADINLTCMERGERMAELEALIVELLHEYYKAKLQVIDEYVNSSYFDEVIAELDEEMAVWRERAGIKEQPPSEYEGEGVA